MKDLTFDLPIFNDLNHAPLSINQQSVKIQLNLAEGEQLFRSELLEIGTFYDYKLFAYLSIPYSYDSENEFITIPGVDDVFGNQITIHTSLNKNSLTNNSLILNTAGVITNKRNFWKDFTENTPAVKQVFDVALHHTIDTLTQKLLDSGIQGVIHTGTAPIVYPDNFHSYQEMFMPEAEKINQPTLEDIQEVQLHVDSTYGGTITWGLNYSFANVLGSTHDPKPSGYKSWIQLWRDKCNGGHDTTKCSSYNYSDGSTPFPCNTDNFVGGHVITGTKAKKGIVGGTVYIFPICTSHNNDDNVYMSMRYNPTGVVLKNYFK